jgi:hypothetical protein
MHPPQANQSEDVVVQGMGLKKLERALRYCRGNARSDLLSGKTRHSLVLSGGILAQQQH